MPRKIVLTKYIFIAINYASLFNYASRMPHKYKIFGCNDGDENWQLVFEEELDSDGVQFTNTYVNPKDSYLKILSDSQRLTNYQRFNTYGLVIEKVGNWGGSGNNTNDYTTMGHYMVVNLNQKIIKIIKGIFNYVENTTYSSIASDINNLILHWKFDDPNNIYYDSITETNINVALY